MKHLRQMTLERAGSTNKEISHQAGLFVYAGVDKGISLITGRLLRGFSFE